MLSKINTDPSLRRIRGYRKYAIGAVAIVFGAIALAGCGSSSGGSNTGSGGGIYGNAPVATSTASGTTNGAQTLTVKRSPGGTSYLSDSTGKTLYLFEADTNGTSHCNGACAAAWPPLTGTVTAGSGVTATTSTFSRSDGGKQAVLNGHPLYYFSGDTTVGTTKGEGVNAFGGLWYVVSPAGIAVTTVN